MITRNSEKIRNKVEKELNTKGHFSKDDCYFPSLYPHVKALNTPYEKEANIMVNKIRREMKDKHNMTKNKYRFLNRQLMKYLFYTTNSSKVKPSGLLFSDFDGDIINIIDIN